jgi:hypothetical protein
MSLFLETLRSCFSRPPFRFRENRLTGNREVIIETTFAMVYRQSLPSWWCAVFIYPLISLSPAMAAIINRSFSRNRRLLRNLVCSLAAARFRRYNAYHFRDTNRPVPRHFQGAIYARAIRASSNTSNWPSSAGSGP